MRILIVEDNVVLALTMDDILSDAGHTVVGLARDERVALELVEELSHELGGRMMPDLALIDLTLARGASGDAVARLLRYRYQVPAVFVSASPLACQKVGHEVRAVGCLAKPFTPDELLDAVEAADCVSHHQPPRRVPANLNLFSAG